MFALILTSFPSKKWKWFRNPHNFGVIPDRGFPARC